MTVPEIVSQDRSARIHTDGNYDLMWVSRGDLGGYFLFFYILEFLFFCPFWDHVWKTRVRSGKTDSDFSESVVEQWTLAPESVKVRTAVREVCDETSGVTTIMDMDDENDVVGASLVMVGGGLVNSDIGENDDDSANSVMTNGELGYSVVNSSNTVGGFHLPPSRVDVDIGVGVGTSQSVSEGERRVAG